ncbi:MAG: FAD-dependent oxidoreductase [Peptococcaceae bacterium BRH_c4a]|nr:MAG: FAD-dependent oxidoreductase [Peptococcaceae bacterium BRH_c4a]
MIVVVGGGWAGCAAACSAAMAGAEVTLLEKTDMLLGTGLVGGIMRNNGRYTALEEISAMGGRELVRIIDRTARHRWVNFPGHRHASLYDVTRIEPVIREFLSHKGIIIKLRARMTDVLIKDGVISGVISDQQAVPGDVFIDTTGTAGPLNNCSRFGTGCAMCILRCPTFGPRVSLTAKAGIKEMTAQGELCSSGAMSGSCKLDKKSLAPWLVNNIERDGVAVVPLPERIKKGGLLDRKACQQYNLREFADNLILLDTGHAKLMTPYFPLEILRTIDGFGSARYEDPYSGGTGNSVRFMAIAPAGEKLQVMGMANLLCAGEKTGPLVGHTEAIVTGMLAGHNAAMLERGRELITLPDSTAAGDIISFMISQIKEGIGLKNKYTFSGSVYFERMKDLGLYTTDIESIEKRVSRAGLTGVFGSSY